MHLPQKEKDFLKFFIAFLKFRFHFEHFKKRVDPHS